MRGYEKPSLLGLCFAGASICFAGALITGASGCDSKPTDQQVQQQAADATATAKQGAKQAVAATQEAAASAERTVNDVAAGVKQGIGENAPRIDLNTATQVRLATLPGISFSKAGDIVNGRPYTSPRQLVSRGLLTNDQYAQISTQVTVGK
jgi:DNA uptake protein ComE-like DNA-binding protein